ncbi:phage tail protein [Synechococcus elongatus]|uniref:phage tail protein n=1 Tax=Synechococcus elongatus TaxID=32046 RepID=UPI000F7D8004|nr:phage tail protein [Synechococcus elongatus]
MNLDRLPVGAIVSWPVPTPPANWLLLNGSTFSGATFPQLQAALGTTTLPDARGNYIRSEAIAGPDSTESTAIRGLLRETAFALLQNFTLTRTFTTPSSAAGGHNHQQLNLVSTTDSYGTVHDAISGGGAFYHPKGNDPRAVAPFVSRTIAIPVPSHTHSVGTFPTITSFTHGSAHTFTANNSVQLSSHTHRVSATLTYSVSTPNQSVETNALRMYWIIRAAIA